MSSLVEVLLLEDITGLGKFGQKKQVKSGYARNYLFPQLLAILNNPRNAARFEVFRKKEDKRRAEEKAVAQVVFDQLNGKTFSFTAKTHGEGKLYGSVSVADVLEAIKAKHGVELERKQLVLEDGLKEVGQFQIPLALHSELVGDITVEVVAA